MNKRRLKTVLILVFILVVICLLTGWRLGCQNAKMIMAPSDGRLPQRIPPPHPIASAMPNSPPAGTAVPAVVLGREEWKHVRASIYGLPESSAETIGYERRETTTTVSFPSGWSFSIDNGTGRIVEPPGLPPFNPAALSATTWNDLKTNGSIEASERDPGDASGERTRRFKLDETRRVADRDFVAWRLVDEPGATDGSFLRLVYWLDARTGTILFSGEEINEP